MRIRIAGELQEMASTEILDHIPASAYKRIKAKDDKPEFRAYCIGHEGESEGKVVGIGKIVKKWARAAIEKLNAKLTIGTKIFHLHEADSNDHEGRKPIAEVVGKTLSDAMGRLSSIAIAYIYPDYRDLPLDVASIEADITLPTEMNPHARSVDVDVEDITAVVLGNSKTNKPGFAGATLLASLQEFADNATHGNNRSKGDEKMTLDDLKRAVKEGRFSPSDVYSDEEIANDSYVRDLVRLSRKGEYEHRTRTDEKFKEESAKWEQEKKDLQAKLEAKEKILLKTRAGESLKPAIEKRRLDEKQTTFILKNAIKFEPKTEESLAGDIDRFLDAQLDEYKANAEIFGIKTETGGKAGVGAGKSGDTSAEDLLTPDALKDEIKK